MIRIRSALKSAGISVASVNHGLRVRSKLKAGWLASVNHGLRVRSTLKAGGLTATNHGGRPAQPRSEQSA